MPTKRQIEANRLNAQKSTGPRTLQGKAVSKFNALQTGINALSDVVPSEDRDALIFLTEEYYERWQPALPEQRCLVDILVGDEWLLRRLRKAEAQLWAHAETQYCIWDGRKTNGHQGTALERNGQEFARLQRRITATEKSYHLNLTALKAIEAQTPEVADLPDIQPAAPEPAIEPQPEIGFVPQTAPELDQPEASEPAAAPEPQIGFVPQVAPKRAAAAVAQVENDPPVAGTALPQPRISLEIGDSYPFSPVG